MYEVWYRVGRDEEWQKAPLEPEPHNRGEVEKHRRAIQEVLRYMAGPDAQAEVRVRLPSRQPEGA